MSDLFLSDDPPPRKGRPRWVDGLGLAVVAVGIVAVGLLGDRGAKRESGAQPTTSTTTSTTSPFERGRPNVATTTSSTPEVSTTTTVLRLGPALPFVTNTVLLLGADSSGVLVDVDARTAVRLPIANGYGFFGLDEGFILPGNGNVELLPVRGPPVRPLETGHGFASQLLASGPHAFWSMTAGEDGTVDVVELDTAGHPTGRKVHLPVSVYVSGAVDDGLVVAGHGSLTFVDAQTGRARSLGTGDLAAAGGHWVVRLACELLACRTELVDVRTGTSRVLTGVPDPGGYVRQGVVSADSRWIALSLVDVAGGPSLTVVNVATGHAWSTSSSSRETPVAFSTDSSVVFAIDSGRLCAYRTATGTPHCLDGLDASAVQQLAAAPAP